MVPAEFFRSAGRYSCAVADIRFPADMVAGWGARARIGGVGVCLSAGRCRYGNAAISHSQTTGIRHGNAGVCVFLSVAAIWCDAAFITADNLAYKRAAKDDCRGPESVAEIA